MSKTAFIGHRKIFYQSKVRERLEVAVAEQIQNIRQIFYYRLLRNQFKHTLPNPRRHSGFFVITFILYMRIRILSMLFRIFSYNRSMKFAERLKELRIERKLTQEELAKIIDCKQSTIARYENGMEPTATIICKLADCFGVSADYLLGRQDWY